MICLFVSDLHGRKDRYRALFRTIETERPAAVFCGGDLFPRHTDIARFMDEEFFLPLRSIAADTDLFVIMGNDDKRELEGMFLDADRDGVLHYVNMRKVPFGDLFVRGYSFVPPSPFMLKDWEKRDERDKVPFLSVPPEEGITTVERDREEMVRSSIDEDLGPLKADPDMGRTLFLFHAPPYGTCLDLVGYAHPGFDPHVGSGSVRRFIETAQPLVTMHGHIHESVSLTGQFKERLGRTTVLGASYEGEGLCLVRFDPGDPGSASRDILL
jgi:Icc-related predicted phosphoesterase